MDVVALIITLIFCYFCFCFVFLTFYLLKVNCHFSENKNKVFKGKLMEINNIDLDFIYSCVMKTEIHLDLSGIFNVE